MAPRRLRRLPSAEVGGVRVPVATDVRSRLLGLAFLPREVAGEGLLIPRCRCVHSFGMRFDLRVVFLDSGGATVREMCLRPGRVAGCRGAVSVLELPVCS
jgi:uncharacterized protein